jgi:hypothetical protein
MAGINAKENIPFFFNQCTKLHEGSYVPTFLKIHKICDDLTNKVKQPQTKK